MPTNVQVGVDVNVTRNGFEALRSLNNGFELLTRRTRMATDAGARFGGSISTWAQTIGAVTPGMSRMGTLLGGGAGIAGAAGVAAAALSALGVTTIRTFSNNDRAIREANTLFQGFNATTRAEIRDTAKELSTRYHTSILEVAAAYSVAGGAGLEFADSQEFVQQALRFAAANFSDVRSASEFAIQAMNAFELEAEDMTRITNTLTIAFDEGVFRGLGEFATALPNVSQAAGQAGIQIEEIAASLAIMTQAGFSATRASTALGRLISDLINPANRAAKGFERIAGKSFPEFIKSGGTLLEAIQLLAESADDIDGTFFDLFEGTVNIRGVRALSALARSSEEVTRLINVMGYTTDATSARIEEALGGVQGESRGLRSEIGALSDVIGEDLAPAGQAAASVLGHIFRGTRLLIEDVNGLTDSVDNAVYSFLDWASEGRRVGGEQRSLNTAVREAGEVTEAYRNTILITQETVDAYNSALAIQRSLTEGVDTSTIGFTFTLGQNTDEIRTNAEEHVAFRDKLLETITKQGFVRDALNRTSTELRLGVPAIQIWGDEFVIQSDRVINASVAASQAYALSLDALSGNISNSAIQQAIARIRRHQDEVRTQISRRSSTARDTSERDERERQRQEEAAVRAEAQGIREIIALQFDNLSRETDISEVEALGDLIRQLQRQLFDTTTEEESEAVEELAFRRINDRVEARQERIARDIIINVEGSVITESDLDRVIEASIARGVNTGDLSAIS